MPRAMSASLNAHDDLLLDAEAPAVAAALSSSPAPIDVSVHEDLAVIEHDWRVFEASADCTPTTSSAGVSARAPTPDSEVHSPMTTTDRPSRAAASSSAGPMSLAGVFTRSRPMKRLSAMRLISSPSTPGGSASRAPGLPALR